MTLKKLIERNSLDPGHGKVVTVEDHPVALFNVSGEYFALDNTCPHRGGSLGWGKLNGEVVTCPWHGWEFNCRTGEALENPGIKVERFTLCVKEDGIYVEW
ncbi:MAG: Rieske (2Fe-2S) protein [Candidatus Neomarinimicrobiota bacterium]